METFHRGFHGPLRSAYAPDRSGRGPAIAAYKKVLLHLVFATSKIEMGSTTETSTLANSVVYVIDDDSQTCRAISELVYSFGFQVRSFDSAAQFLEVYDDTHPGCVILDVRMPGIGGLDLHRQLIERESGLSVILITAFADTRLVVGTLRQGAIAVLDKPFKDEELWSFVQEGVQTSELVHFRRHYLKSLEQRFKILSQPDREVLKLMMDGVKNRSIATRLEVSLRTVENRRRRIFEAMQADSVAELTRMVVEYEHKLIPEPEVRNVWIDLPYDRVTCQAN